MYMCVCIESSFNFNGMVICLLTLCAGIGVFLIENLMSLYSPLSSNMFSRFFSNVKLSAATAAIMVMMTLSLFGCLEGLVESIFTKYTQQQNGHMVPSPNRFLTRGIISYTCNFNAALFSASSRFEGNELFNSPQYMYYIIIIN